MRNFDSKAAEIQQLSLLSPAKINVYFRVLHKRCDGFHEISSLYQAVTLCDTLEIKLSSVDEFTCSDSSLSLDHTNLVSRALALFRRKTDCRQHFAIHLDKKIPIQAGLGGGSSNAATALWGFLQLTGIVISQEELFSWGAELGSDVPFFFSSGVAKASGRGEVLVDAVPFIDVPFWIVKPKMGLSTAEVYQRCRPSQKKRQEEEMLYNDLEEAAFSLNPALLKLKEDLLFFGFKTVLLCGSGTSFFCLESKTSYQLLELKKSFPELQIFQVKPLQRKQLRWYE